MAGAAGCRELTPRAQDMIQNPKSPSKSQSGDGAFGGKEVSPVGLLRRGGFSVPLLHRTLQLPHPVLRETPSPEIPLGQPLPFFLPSSLSSFPRPLGVRALCSRGRPGHAGAARHGRARLGTARHGWAGSRSPAGRSRPKFWQLGRPESGPARRLRLQVPPAAPAHEG